VAITLLISIEQQSGDPGVFRNSAENLGVETSRVDSVGVCHGDDADAVPCY
jgi:hypothetical protein